MSGAPIDVPAPTNDIRMPDICFAPDLRLVPAGRRRPPRRLTRRGWVALYLGLAAAGFAAGVLWPFVVMPG